MNEKYQTIENYSTFSRRRFTSHDSINTHTRSYTRTKGFTLIELLIVIAILSILATTAVPMYSAYVQRGKIAEALATLGNLSTRMEKNYLDFRKYTNDKGNCAISNPDNDNFKFSCTSEGQSYTWTATSKDGKYQYSINDDFNKETLAFAGESQSSVNCWMISDSGNCY